MQQEFVLGVNVHNTNSDIQSAMNRALWFRIHSFVGFKLAILMSFILVTGTLAVLSHELDWATNKAMRVSPDSVNRLRFDSVYRAAYAHSEQGRLMYINAPIDPWFATEAIYQYPQGLHRHYFHPDSGAYQGDGRWYNWQRFFRMSHRHLMLPTVIGITVVGILGVFMLLSLLTSFVVYKGWWKGFSRLPRTRNRQLFWADMHRLTGVWSMWFVLIISVTGVWYLAERWGANAQYPQRAKAVTQQAVSEAVLPSPERFEALLHQVAVEYPELKIERILLPQKAGQTVTFQGQAEALLVRPRVNAMSFDPVSGETLQILRGQDMSLHVRISEAADPLHFGTFAGLTSKLIYFVFGIVLCVLAISGTFIYGVRIAKNDRLLRQSIQREEAGSNAIIWRAATTTMSWGKWLSVLFIAVCLALTFYMFSGLFDLS